VEDYWRALRVRFVVALGVRLGHHTFQASIGSFEIV